MGFVTIVRNASDQHQSPKAVFREIYFHNFYELSNAWSSALYNFHYGGNLTHVLAAFR